MSKFFPSISVFTCVLHDFWAHLYIYTYTQCAHNYMHLSVTWQKFRLENNSYLKKYYSELTLWWLQSLAIYQLHRLMFSTLAGVLIPTTSCFIFPTKSSRKKSLKVIGNSIWQPLLLTDQTTPGAGAKGPPLPRKAPTSGADFTLPLRLTGVFPKEKLPKSPWGVNDRELTVKWQEGMQTCRAQNCSP